MNKDTQEQSGVPDVITDGKKLTRREFLLLAALTTAGAAATACGLLPPVTLDELPPNFSNETTANKMRLLVASRDVSNVRFLKEIVPIAARTFTSQFPKAGSPEKLASATKLVGSEAFNTAYFNATGITGPATMSAIEFVVFDEQKNPTIWVWKDKIKAPDGKQSMITTLLHAYGHAHVIPQFVDGFDGQRGTKVDIRQVPVDQKFLDSDGNQGALIGFAGFGVYMADNQGRWGMLNGDEGPAELEKDIVVAHAGIEDVVVKNPQSVIRAAQFTRKIQTTYSIKDDDLFNFHHTSDGVGFVSRLMENKKPTVIQTVQVFNLMNLVNKGIDGFNDLDYAMETLKNILTLTDTFPKKQAFFLKNIEYNNKT